MEVLLPLYVHIMLFTQACLLAQPIMLRHPQGDGCQRCVGVQNPAIIKKLREFLATKGKKYADASPFFRAISNANYRKQVCS